MWCVLCCFFKRVNIFLRPLLLKFLKFFCFSFFLLFSTRVDNPGTLHCTTSRTQQRKENNYSDNISNLTKVDGGQTTKKETEPNKRMQTTSRAQPFSKRLKLPPRKLLCNQCSHTTVAQSLLSDFRTASSHTNPTLTTRGSSWCCRRCFLQFFFVSVLLGEPEMLVLGLARTVKRGVSVRSDSRCHLRMGLEHGRLLQMSWKWMTMMRVTSVVCSAQDGTSSGAAVMCRRWNRAAGRKKSIKFYFELCSNE